MSYKFHKVYADHAKTMAVTSISKEVVNESTKSTHLRSLGRCLLKNFLNIVTLLILFLTLTTYQEANSINRKSHIAWLKITDPKIVFEGGSVKISYSVTNVSTDPAFKVHTYVSGDPANLFIRKDDTEWMLLPTNQFDFTYQTIPDSNSSALYENIINGTILIKFYVMYLDVYKSPVTVIETDVFDKNGLGQPIKESADGPDLN